MTALPPLLGNQENSRWKINVNTATAVVLASLLPNVSVVDAEPLVNGAYENVATFREDFPGGAQIPPTFPLDIRSHWFC